MQPTTAPTATQTSTEVVDASHYLLPDCGFYPLSSIEGTWRWLILANPMTPVVEIFRFAFLGTSAMSPVYLLYSIAFMFVVLLIGVLIFNRVENTFMDTV